MAEYTTIKISPEIWKLINQERSHNETMNEVLQRILSDRQKLKDMLMRSSSRIDLK